MSNLENTTEIANDNAQSPSFFDRIERKPLWQMLFLFSIFLFCAITILLSYFAATKGLLNSAPYMCVLDSQMDKANYGFSCKPELLKHVYKQLAIMNARENFHSHLASVYYKFYFTFSAGQVVFSSLSTLLLFFILKDGWSKAKWSLRNSFAIIAFFATIMYSMPLVLQNKVNISNNTRVLTSYYRQELYTTGQLQKIDSTNCMDSSLIWKLLDVNNKMLQENLELYYDIDPTHLPNPNDWRN